MSWKVIKIEQDAELNIWTYEGGRDEKLEKFPQ
jgi:hypothetical protein